MNNEPVAWMSSMNGKTVYVGYEPAEGYLAIPLYTHPANPKYDPETGEPLIDGYPLFSGLPPPPAKTLTIEEILEVAKQKGWRGDLKFLVDFADEILRKAQEK